MPPSDALIPAGLGRLGTFLGFAGAGTFAAFAGAWALVFVGFDRLFWAFLLRWEAVLLIAGGCGVVVGLAAASGRTSPWRRAGVASVVLLVTGLVATATIESLPQPAFSAAAFRSAPDPYRSDERERQAYRAVEQDALIGLTPAELRGALGEPDRIGRRRNVWIWDVGMIHDAIGPGDGGALYVRFDPTWARVVSAEIDDAGF